LNRQGRGDRRRSEASSIAEIADVAGSLVEPFEARPEVLTKAILLFGVTFERNHDRGQCGIIEQDAAPTLPSMIGDHVASDAKCPRDERALVVEASARLDDPHGDRLKEIVAHTPLMDDSMDKRRHRRLSGRPQGNSDARAFVHAGVGLRFSLPIPFARASLA
jgi:hypothetical protein